MKRVSVQLRDQSEPIVRDNVVNTYEKGKMFCVMTKKGKKVEKYPIENIFRVVEEDV